MGRFEKIPKIDGYIDGCGVIFVASHNDMEIYKNTGDSPTIWLVQNGQVIFSFYQKDGEMFVAEEFMKL